jgi:hypothetical protein
MITATNPLYCKINSHLQLRTFVGRRMELPRHLGEVLGGTNLDQFHLGVPPQTPRHRIERAHRPRPRRAARQMQTFYVAK